MNVATDGLALLGTRASMGRDDKIWLPYMSNNVHKW